MKAPELLQAGESAVTQGRLAEAAPLLRTLSRAGSELSREERLKLAGLCRRAHLPMLTVRLLAGRVRPRKSTPGIALRSARVEEIAEYASALGDLGAVGECIQLLDSIPASEISPTVLLFKAFARIRRWEWKQAEVFLRGILQHPRSRVQAKLAARVYLASASLHGSGDWKGAGQELRSALDDVGMEKLGALGMNARLLLAQACYFGGRLEECGAALDDLEQTLSGSGRRSAAGPVLLGGILQWRTLLALASRRTSRSEAVRTLRGLADQFRGQGTWELARAADFYAGWKLRDALLRAASLRGTVDSGARRHFARAFESDPLKLPTEWAWTPGLLPEHREWSPDAITFRKLGLKDGHLLGRLMVKLASDFYRPHSVPALNEALYPDEAFHPESSRIRIHEACKRLRVALENQRSGLTLESTTGGYRLICRSGGGLRVTSTREEDALAVHQPVASGYETKLEHLRQRYGRAEFAAAAAAASLKMTPQGVTAFLREEMRRGKLVRIGNARATRYRFL